MLISDSIAKMIEAMLEECGGTLDIKRNDMAERLGCAPSQINYVITSRFTPERGYIIESRRGGGGYIRIVRKQIHKNEYLMHFFHAIGEDLEENEAMAYLRNLKDNGLLNRDEALLAAAALSNKALLAIPDRALKNSVRADIMRQIILMRMD